MIKQIQRDTDAAVSAIDAGTKEVEAGKMSAANAAKALGTIIARIDAVSVTIQHLAHASEAQMNAKQGSGYKP